MSICKKCGQESEFREGFNKEKGKAWAGYFCTDKQNCKNVEWVKAKRSNENPYATAPDFKEPWNGRVQNPVHPPAPKPTPPAELKKKNEARISALAVVKSLIESGFYEAHKGDPDTMKDKIFNDVDWFERRWA